MGTRAMLLRGAFLARADAACVVTVCGATVAQLPPSWQLSQHIRSSTACAIHLDVSMPYGLQPCRAEAQGSGARRHMGAQTGRAEQCSGRSAQGAVRAAHTTGDIDFPG